MTVFVLLLGKTLAVFAVSGLILLALRRASAATRHLVCLLTLGALLALPLFSLTLPGWRLPVLTEPTAQEPTPVQAPTLPRGEGEERKPGLAPRKNPPPTPSPMKSKDGEGASQNTMLNSPSHSGGGVGEGSLLALYLLGVLLAALRPLLGLRGIAHLRRACVPVTDPLTLTLAADCAAILRLARPVTLCTAAVPVPMTWGWRRPVVLLPSESAVWLKDRTEAVLLHEMAHIKRRDWLSHRLADCVCALYWFHPLVWLTARRLRAEGEIACDDLVLASGIAAPDYARHLLDIARALPPSPRPTQSAIAMAQISQIEERLKMILDNTHSRRTLTRRVLLTVLGLGTVALVMLAVLKPTAKAQSAPNIAVASSASATPPDSPLNLDFGSVVESPDGHGGTMIVTSSDVKVNGTTLFAGVTDANKPGGAWWSASGAVLPTPVYDTSAYHAENHAPADKKSVIFAFRLPETAQGATLQYDLPQSLQSSSDGAWPGKSGYDVGLTEAQQFSLTDGTRVVTAEYPNTLSKANIRVGIASGPWKATVSEIETPGALKPFGGTGTSVYGSTFILASPVETATGSVLMVSTDSTRDIRLVAIDKQGNELFPTSVGSNGVSTLNQITAHFSQPITQIKEFRVESRPFQWIVLKDVALRPAQ